MGTEEVEADFGHEKVTPDEKTRRVGDVFKTVAGRYDVMNDFMSLGTHRLFKRMLLQMSGVKAGDSVLDLAGGTGDMARLFAPVVGRTGHVVLADLNEPMMIVGRDRLLDEGYGRVHFCRTPAESLPFADGIFDCACISFGLRNFTNKDTALEELYRVLKPGAALLVLEFSHPTNPLVHAAYNAFQSIWPLAGRIMVGDAQPYEYLVDSIEVHPGQAALKQMLEDARFTEVEYFNLMTGIVAIHRGTKAYE